MSQQRILVIEDEHSLVDVLSYNLGNEGFEVLSATDGALQGTLSFAAPEGGESPPAWKLRGALNEQRIHLFGSREQDWVRLEAKRSESGWAGQWTGEVAFKPVAGTWTLARVKATGDDAKVATDTSGKADSPAP